MKRVTNTDKTELVETQNLALSLKRLTGAPHDGDRWKRALYHAIGMSDVCYSETKRKIREALELP